MIIPQNWFWVSTLCTPLVSLLFLTFISHWGKIVYMKHTSSVFSRIGNVFFFKQKCLCDLHFLCSSNDYILEFRVWILLFALCYVRLSFKSHFMSLDNKSYSSIFLLDFFSIDSEQVNVSWDIRKILQSKEEDEILKKICDDLLSSSISKS